ncbi:MAG: hypothetical protein R3D60_11330 [Paracoccaceae bacterium]
MLISLAHRFVFVANTKCASTSLVEVLAPFAPYRARGSARLKHLPLSQARRAFGLIFDDPDWPFDSFFRFGVMRDPLDWIASWYRYRLQPGIDAALPPGTTFAQFWERGDWNIRRRDGRPFGQADKFLDDDGRCLADVILPYDRLAEGVEQVCRGLGLTPLPLPRRNASPPATSVIPPDLVAPLRRHFARDYALFDQLATINATGFGRMAERNAACLT